MTRKPITTVDPTTADSPWLALSMTMVKPVDVPPLGVVVVVESFPQATAVASPPATNTKRRKFRIIEKSLFLSIGGSFAPSWLCAG
jgi:hypothetical protein